MFISTYNIPPRNRVCLVVSLQSNPYLTASLLFSKAASKESQSISPWGGRLMGVELYQLPDVK